ncbi:hypothetical protein PLESTF_000837600 [Pleodorina starrii]|nr:hypothetical protein PLESTF_000837600 [Pleodorina starrii]
MHRVWWSKRQHRLPVTLFTHSDLSRLKSVEAQCRGYPGGIISVAVWVPLIAHNSTAPAPGRPPPLTPSTPEYLDAAHKAALENATAILEHLFLAMETPGQPPSPSSPEGSGTGTGTTTSATSTANQTHETCVMRLMLVEDDVMASLMPLNILRNAAMLAATTPLVAMVDADMALSWSFASRVLVNATRAAELERRAVQERVVWVIPIFDTDDKLPLPERMALAEAAVQREGARLLSLWHSEERVFPYGSRGFSPGHAPTDCVRWSGAYTDHEVEYREGKALPPYDSRFRGYFRDKIVNTAYVASLGFKFRVLPDVWMVHRPHEPCVASYKWQWYHNLASNPTPLEKLVPLPNGTWIRARAANNVHSLSTYKESTSATANGSYQLVLNEATVFCRAVLRWWR